MPIAEDFRHAHPHTMSNYLIRHTQIFDGVPTYLGLGHTPKPVTILQQRAGRLGRCLPKKFDDCYLHLSQAGLTHL